MGKYLYHYTSIETLEKILESKTLCFTSLSLVDDLDEVETADIKKFGCFCFVSCWTREDRESISMWKMYTPEMQGVRIKMKEFPFKKYVIQPGELNNREEIRTCINLFDRNAKNLPFILQSYPQLREIDYTEREELLYPVVKTENVNTITEILIENGQKRTKTKENKTISYSTEHIGEFKRKCWEFQKEWRYKLIVAPYTYDEFCKCKNRNDQEQLLMRLEDENYFPKEERVFLDLDNEAITEMQILIGPKASDEQIEYVKCLAKKYGINISNIQKSNLRIR